MGLNLSLRSFLKIMSIDALRVTWDRCDRCGGDLPLVDGDNGSSDLPESITGGECPGYVSPNGHCGCYDDATLETWLEALK